MKLLAVLLLYSLASTSPAILHESEDEIPMETQTTGDSAQFAPTSHPRKASISSEALTTEPFHFRKELISKGNAVIKSTRSMSQKPEMLHPIFQEDSSKSSIEESTEFTPTPASTSEGKLNSVGYQVGKELKKVIKGIVDYLKGLIPNANDVMKP